MHGAGKRLHNNMVRGRDSALIPAGKADKMLSMYERNDTVLGVLAHVDAGKTTLCEAMLYLSGKL